MKKVLAVLLIFCMTLSFVSCKSSLKDTSSDSTKLAVSVTFNAMAEFVAAVGRDRVNISTIIPTGMEPHDFEPKAADIAALSNSQVFIYNGLGMEVWAEEAIKAAENESLVIVVASDNSTPFHNTEEEEIEEHGQYDPHIWLSLKGAEIEVQNIADGLSSADPDNREYYETNATSYIAQLESLFNEYEEKFSSLENKKFVTGHAAFHYFCRDFGLEQNSVEDVFAEGEPSTRQLAELVDYCRENNVSTIFAEEMASPEISQALANEVGAGIETIHTIESSDDGMTYLDRMRENCEKIYKSLSK
ncbi:MAG: transporter substrate-binding lipoprotein [Herbinix sp.]|jgi:zinc transport system substrate-binding protein|nr:transporter substrate-binding lipoprotein [Herbinix sp.]